MVDHGGRCSDDLTKLKAHIASAKPIHNGKGQKICVVCSQPCGHECIHCGQSMHFTIPRNSTKKWSCFFDYHDITYLGLAYSDYKLTLDASGNRRVKKKYQEPTFEEKISHATKIRRLMPPPFRLSTPARDTEDDDR